MPDLNFQVERVEPTPNAIAPQLSFYVRASDAQMMPIHSIALRIQVQLEPAKRRYTAEEQQKLVELFGEPERWSQSVHPLLWANVNVNVPAFDGSTLIEVPVPCTFDFNVAVTKYIHGLDAGELPCTLLFSGTVFYAGRMGLQIAQIPWERSANYRLPISVWQQMMNQYYPNTAWLCLHRDAFEKLNEFKVRNGFSSWEQALERILPGSEASEGELKVKL